MYRFHIQQNIATNKFDLRMVDMTESGTFAARNVTFEKVDPAAQVDPLVALDPEAAQSLADQLWEAGVRPQGAMRAVATAAQQVGGQVAPWLMRQLEKFIDNATKEKAQ